MFVEMYSRACTQYTGNLHANAGCVDFSWHACEVPHNRDSREHVRRTCGHATGAKWQWRVRAAWMVRAPAHTLVSSVQATDFEGECQHR
jgi:hypothetical protein